MTAHWPTTPSAVVDAMLAAFATIQRDPTHPTRPVRTVARVEDDSKDAIDRACTPGLPALLVYDAGGKAETVSTHGQKFAELMTFRLIAASGELRSARDRHQATGVGVEDLCNVGLYLALRAAAAMVDSNGKRVLHLVRPVKRTQSVQIDPGKWLAAWDIEARRPFDIWDDALETSFDELGFVANPVDPAELFLEDGSPNIVDPATQQGGVATL